MESAEQAFTSVRLNPSKKASTYAFPLNDQVQWSSSGFYLSERPSFTFDPIFHGGAYYVQEPSSMIIEYIFDKINRKGPIKVLDLCAAPGGKSTLLASLLSHNDILVSNEVIRTRFSILSENMVKWGAANVLLTNLDPKEFQKTEAFFDMVLVDAPCSGEGLWRKDPSAKEEWSDDHVFHCSIRQKRILADVLPALKPGGHLIYCTCTFNDQENIHNVSWLERTFQLSSTTIELPSEWNIQLREKETSIGYQIDPEHARGEGFFFSLLRKPDSSDDHHQSVRMRKSNNFPWMAVKNKVPFKDYLQDPDSLTIMKNQKDEYIVWPTSSEDQFRHLCSNFNRIQPVLQLGIYKNQKIIPSHALAMSNLLSQDVPRLSLDKEQAIQYLRRNDHISLSAESTSIWNLASYERVPLGWIKMAGSKMKNRYPMQWRIRKQSV